MFVPKMVQWSELMNSAREASYIEMREEVGEMS